MPLKFLDDVAFDIETKPDEESAIKAGFFTGIKAPSNYKDEEKIEAYIKEKEDKMRDSLALEPRFAEIVVFGYKSEEEEGVFTTLPNVENAKIFNSEADLIKEALYNVLYDAKRLISFNGKAYDIPVIMYRALKNGIPISPYLFAEWTSKYKLTNHIDLTLFFDKSMDFNLQYFFNKPKKPINFKHCSNQELVDHNREDIQNLWKMWEMFR